MLVGVVLAVDLHVAELLLGSIARLKRSIWFWMARSSGVLMLPFSL
jgi:hypothetical protein